MKKNINVMGFGIDVLTYRNWFKKMQQYLSNDHLNIIYFMTVNMIQHGEGNEEYKELIACADYLLPGEDAVLKSYFGEKKLVNGVIMNYRVLEHFFPYLKQCQKSVFVVYDQNETMKTLHEFIGFEYPNLVSESFNGLEREGESERIINAINAEAPDVLLLAIATPEQEQWLSENHTKLNAKLCLGIGGVMEAMKKQSDNGPGIAERLTMNLRTRIFRRKLVNYNTKKR